MKAFKYLVFFLLFIIASSSYSAVVYRTYGGFTGSTPTEACKKWRSDAVFKSRADYAPNYIGECSSPSSGATPLGVSSGSCPSATQKDLKVALNAQSYQCVQGCQYKLRACVDVDFEPGMTCSAISTGAVCGQTKPKEPPKPSDPITPDRPDNDTNDQSKPTENTANSQSTSTSSSQSTTTSSTDSGGNTINNTTTTSTTNTTTNTIINLDRLESVIKNMTSVLSNKLDAILGKMDQDGGPDGGTGDADGDGTDLTQTNAKLDENNSLLSDLKDWLTGGEDGSNGSGGDNPFGNDAVPEKALTPQDLKTNIFSGSAACPADRTLSFQLFTGKTFSKSFSFAMWCDKLAIFGTLILIASYLYGAYIITSKS